MTTRAAELCRQLRPVLGSKIDRLWSVYLADPDGRTELEITLELLARQHLKQDYQPDRAPFPPPEQTFATSGELEIGTVTYAQRGLFPFRLPQQRLTEHVLIAGRSGSGKTNLAFVLLDRLMQQDTRVLVLDWKRSYRNLRQHHPDLTVYTPGRDVAPLAFNPLIPPPECEPHVWLKLVVDVVASAYLGGEGVISLLIAGLEKLYTASGVFTGQVARWPTFIDLLAWLRGTKLKGRAAMWQASAERILVALTYGEFGTVLNAQTNEPIRTLLDRNVVIEMDGLSGSADRTMFSEALMLYLYRLRLAAGPQRELTNVIALEEAHNLLLAKPSGSRESVLESSIRTVREYGLGFVFIDQSASLLSKVAFANSYATIGLSQKLAADVRTLAGAMNLTDAQRDALSTLPVGTAVVRLADEHPEPFLIRIPAATVKDRQISDADIRRACPADYTDSGLESPPASVTAAVTPVPAADRNPSNAWNPPTPSSSPTAPEDVTLQTPPLDQPPPEEQLSRDALRFLVDVAARPLSTTVARYQRLHLSRRKGNAIREDLRAAGLIAPVTIATRSGQVVLHELTDAGRQLAGYAGVDVPPTQRPSLEHRFWVAQATEYLEREGYRVDAEHGLRTGGFVDLLAERGGRRVAVEIETGKSDIAANIEKLAGAAVDELILIATSPAAVAACQRALAAAAPPVPVSQLSWLDVSS